MLKKRIMTDQKQRSVTEEHRFAPALVATPFNTAIIIKLLREEVRDM